MARRSIWRWFFGGSNVADASNADVEESINIYAELIAPGNSKVEGYLQKRPGLTPFATVADSNGRCSFAEDGRAWQLTGATFSEVFADGTTINRGTVGNTSNRTSIVSNGTAGNQLLVCDGVDGWVYDLTLNTLTKIDNTNFPGTGFPYGTAIRVEFINGWGIVLWRNSRKFGISALEDFTSWDPLDVAERSEGSDNIVTVVRNHLELWLPGTKTGEVWYPNGDALFPFAPVPGVFLQFGVAGGWASSGRPMIRFGPETTGGTVAFVTQTEDGHATVCLAGGDHAAKPIGTHAIQAFIESAPINGEHVFLWSFTLKGHTFLVLLYPELALCPVYDLATNRWFKWAHWNSTLCVYEPFIPSCHMFAFGKHLVGCYTSGIIYELTAAALTDDLV